MSSLRNLLACLALTCAATGCAPTVHAAARPVPIQTELDRAALRAKLAHRRDEVFQRFLAYREARIYPINNLGGMRHLWFDASGNLCAAATLISGDWGHDVTYRVGIANRELKLADVTSGPVLDWMLTSGLTQYELVAIQAPGFNERYMRRQGDPENQRLYQLYTDVERQLRSLWDRNLDAAVDALMKRPALARALLHGEVAGPGPFAKPVPGEVIVGPIAQPPDWYDGAPPAIEEPAAPPAVEPA